MEKKVQDRTKDEQGSKHRMNKEVHDINEADNRTNKKVHDKDMSKNRMNKEQESTR